MWDRGRNPRVRVLEEKEGFRRGEGEKMVREYMARVLEKRTY